MTDAERTAFGEQRRNIFANFCNGVAMEDQMSVEKMSRLEVEKAIVFVAKKIQESRFKSMGGIGPVLARIRNEWRKPQAMQDSAILADLKNKAKALHKHAGTPIEIDLLSDIRMNRVELLMALDKLGPIYLSSELLIPRVNLQKVDGSQGTLEEISHRIAA